MSPASYALIGIRFILGPFLYLDASDGATGPWFLVGLAVGFLSDIFDGVIARRMHTVTPQLRELDGRVDVWFFLWIAVSAWRTRPEVVSAFRFPLLVVLGLQILAWVIDWIKYRRFSNYHAYSAKAFGLSLFAVTLLWFSHGPVVFLMWCATVLGAICMLEEIAITLLLPYWIHDIPSVWHAIKIKAGIASLQNQG